MTQNAQVQVEERLKSPKLEVLQDIINLLDEFINEGADVVLTEPQAVDILDICKWTLTHLSNRKDYHKLKNLKDKAVRQRLEEALRAAGRNVEELKRAAVKEAIDTVIDESAD